MNVFHDFKIENAAFFVVDEPFSNQKFLSLSSCVSESISHLVFVPFSFSTLSLFSYIIVREIDSVREAIIDNCFLLVRDDVSQLPVADDLTCL